MEPEKEEGQPEDGPEDEHREQGEPAQGLIRVTLKPPAPGQPAQR